MHLLITLLLVFSCHLVFSQDKAGCKVEIYLVKKFIPCWDTITRNVRPFTVTMQDLQDTPFIKNEEIALYSIEKRNITICYREKGTKNQKVNGYVHTINTTVSIQERIDSLHVLVSPCGKQFAMVRNGEIIYGGCLNNPLTSWVPPVLILTGSNNSLNLTDGVGAPVKNKNLINCLKSDGRYKYFKTRKRLKYYERKKRRK